MSGWTTPEDIRARVLREWEKGRLLASLVTGEDVFPLRIALKGPSSSELSQRFADVKAWIARLQDAARRGVRLEMRFVEHRVIGTNAVPAEIWIDSLDEALALIGKGRDAGRFQALVRDAQARCATVVPWMAKRPLRALELAAQWSRLLDIVLWLREHPRPSIYLRQVDLPGIHSKFIEQHRSVLSELCDYALQCDVIDTEATGFSQFERRLGFRAKPIPVRFRLLDTSPSLAPGLTDLTLAGEEFARFDPGMPNVFITENEINFLAFPAMANSLVIFGAGYGFDTLAQAAWLRGKSIYYWGDIDTHGFAILDQLRAYFPNAQSLLMDHDTLHAHCDHWVREDKPADRDLPRLTPPEREIYDHLRRNTWGESIRLEQEKIGFTLVARALSALNFNRQCPVQPPTQIL